MDGERKKSKLSDGISWKKRCLAISGDHGGRPDNEKSSRADLQELWGTGKGTNRETNLRVNDGQNRARLG